MFSFGSSDSEQYWIISVPPERGSPEHTWLHLNQKTSIEAPLSFNYKFNIPPSPPLKVGTLGELMVLSDEAVKAETTLEALVRRIATHLQNLVKDRAASKEAGPNAEDPKKALESVMQRLTVSGQPVQQFISNFSWDSSKYPTTGSVKELLTSIDEVTTRLDNELKTHASGYSTTKNSLASADRKAHGNLMVRSLTSIISAKDFIQSDSLTTTLCVVPNHLEKEFLDSYESLAKFVVPRSAKKLHTDKDSSLFAVTHFKKFAQDFASAARQNRFHVREFSFDADSAANEIAGQEALKAELTNQWAQGVRWAQLNFGEAFSALMHLKAVRVLIESVLRYGVPPRFLAAILKPQPKAEAKLRAALSSLYGHLSGGSRLTDDATKMDAEALPGLSAGGAAAAEFYPFVFLKLDVSFLTPS